MHFLPWKIMQSLKMYLLSRLVVYALIFLIILKMNWTYKDASTLEKNISPDCERLIAHKNHTLQRIVLHCTFNPIMLHQMVKSSPWNQNFSKAKAKNSIHTELKNSRITLNLANSSHSKLQNNTSEIKTALRQSQTTHNLQPFLEYHVKTENC
jgi:hypothetical protein